MGNDWNSFMQSKPVRILMNAICAVTTGVYAVGGAMDLVRPSESSLMLKEQMGAAGFYALTAARIVVCLWVCVVFTRMLIKIMQEQE